MAKKSTTKNAASATEKKDVTKPVDLGNASKNETVNVEEKKEVAPVTENDSDTKVSPKKEKEVTAKAETTNTKSPEVKAAAKPKANAKEKGAKKEKVSKSLDPTTIENFRKECVGKIHSRNSISVLAHEYFKGKAHLKQGLNVHEVYFEVDGVRIPEYGIFSVRG